MRRREIEEKLAELNVRIAALEGVAASNPTLAQMLSDLQTQRVELTGDDNIVVQGRDNVTAQRQSIAVRENSGQISYIVNEYHGREEGDDTRLRQQIAEYLQWLGEQCGTIELRGLQSRERVKPLALETAYVPLAVQITPALERESEDLGLGQPRDLARMERQAAVREIASNEILQQGKRLIIAGGPGSGKTTVLAHIAWIVARGLGEDNPALVNDQLGLSVTDGGLPLPLLIPLSAYALYRRNSTGRRDLATFITYYLQEQEAVFDLPDDFFKRLWRRGQGVMLLLDGLDEVPNEAERVQVSRQIEKLVSGRETLRVVVTCRSAAYKGKTPLGKGFRRIDVQPLTVEQIEAMVRQAYAGLVRDRVRREKRTEQLLTGIERMEAERRVRLGENTERLVTSPLLVRMLLVVHYSERRLPEQRAELYLKAVDAMLAPDEYALDAEVGQRLSRLVGGDVKLHREVVQYVAWEMYQRGSAQGREIDERQLRDLLAAHDAYQALADEFIEVTRTRSPLLEERAGRYRFLHLAFQEFLVARYLATTALGRHGLAGVVRLLSEGDWVTESWWREPILLLAGYLNAESTPELAVDFVRLLAQCEGTAETRLAAAEVAGTAVLEWRTEQPALQADTARRIVALLTDEVVQTGASGAVRVQAGVTLAQLGDPRPAAIDVDAMAFCWIPAGPFMLGADDINANSRPAHEVALAYGYGMGRWPVTQAQFAVFVADGGYLDGRWWPEARAERFWEKGQGFKGRYDDRWRQEPIRFGDRFELANHPVVGVSWYEALAFVRWLTVRWRTMGVLSSSWAVVLPSEAEWEKAARGGLRLPETAWWGGVADLMMQQAEATRRNRLPQRKYPWGNAALSEQVANWNRHVGATSAVGSYAVGRSPYGCEEMSGNVWEWTRSHWQAYGERYVADDGREVLDAGAGASRVVRGGAWYAEDAKWLRCGVRDWHGPFDRRYDRGFRIAVSPLISDL